MPLRWISPPVAPQSPLAPEAPKIVLAAPGSVTPPGSMSPPGSVSPPGSITPRHRLTQALAAGSLLAVAVRPVAGLRPAPAFLPPRAAASTFTVINLNASGAGSLRQAISDANANPGPDIVSFQPGLVGTIPITTQLSITDTLDIHGPGPGVLSVSGSNTTRVFYISSTVLFTATISGLTIRDGSATKGSGGIRDKGESLILDNVAIISNTTTNGRGGAVEVTTGGPNQGTLTVRDSIISGNQSTRGGGIFTINMPNPVLIQNTQITSNTATALQGGGAFFYRPAGDITIEDSTIAGNKATSAGGGGLSIYNTYGGQSVIRRTTISGNTSGVGGGIQFFAVHHPVLIENSTLSGNHASISGGAIFLYGPVTIQDSTIVSNTADTDGGGIHLDGSTLPITNTIVANNSAPLNPDLHGGNFVLHSDLVQVTGTAVISDAGGNLFGLDPLLGPLANKGGPTQTHRPTPSSPAINAGDPAFAPPPATDQRGDPRVSNGRVDIGAVEVMAGALQFSASSFQVAENAITATVTVTRTGGSEGAVGVHYATGGGTATPGSNYQAAAGDLNWADGDTAPKTFPVTILNDNLADGNKTVGLTLSNAQGGAVLGAPITATLTITDSGARLFLPLVARS